MTDIQDLKAIAERCKGYQPLRFMQSYGALYIRNDNGIVFDVHQNRSFPDFMSQNKDYADLVLAANPAVVLELIAELEKVKADRKACWEEFKVQGRQLDLVRDENENLRQDARRWQCVRNAVPMQSPYAVWREGSHVVLGKDADELVDNFLSHAKEDSHD